MVLNQKAVKGLALKAEPFFIEKERREMSMRKFLILSCAMMMLITPLTVSATEVTPIEENGTEETATGAYEYYANFDSVDKNNSPKSACRNTISSSLPLCMYLTETIDGVEYYSIRYYDVSRDSLFSVSEGDSRFTLNYEQYSYDSKTVTGSGVGLVAVRQGTNSRTGYCYILETNIPMFDSYEDALKYLRDGDDSGMTNRPEPQIDETFYLIGFEADNTVTAVWTGTSHDDKGLQYSLFHIELTAIHEFSDNSDYAVGKAIYHQNGYYPIGAFTLTKLMEELKEECTLDGEYVSCLQFSPFYKIYDSVLAPKYYGLSTYVYFDEDGNIIGIKTGEEAELENPDLYLDGVECNLTTSAKITGGLEHKITWTGVNDVMALLGVPSDDATVYISYSYYTDVDVVETVEYSELEFYKGLLGSYPTLIGDREVLFWTEKVQKELNEKGYQFTGLVYLTPKYKKDNHVYLGGTTCVNVLTGEIKKIVKGENNEPIEIPVTPPDDGGGNDIKFPSDGNITDIFQYMFDMFSALFAYIGQVPQLLTCLFAFVPEPLIYLISFALVIVVILRILGR